MSKTRFRSRYPGSLAPLVRRARRPLAVALLAGSALVVTGCARNKGNAAQPASPGLADGSTPLVISGTPVADTTAFRSASRSLLTAQHGVIEDMGPDPSWRRVRNNRDMTLSAAQDAGDPEQGLEPRPSTAAGARRGRRPSAAVQDGQPGALVTLDAAEEPEELGPITSSGLNGGANSQFEPNGPMAPEFIRGPAARTALPDGRIRIIWHLRSFGGPKVTSGDSGNSRRKVTLAPGDLAPLIAVLQGHLADKGQVLSLPNENKLIITCTADAENDVLALLTELDIPAPQVEITAKIFEVSHNFDYQQGARILMNRLAENGAQQALTSFQTERLLDSVANAIPFQGSVISLLQTFENAGISVEASFELLAEAGLIHVVSSPRLTVAEGQTGYRLAGQELPIQSINIVNNNLHATTQYKPVGVQLYITPQAIGDGLIKLHTVSIVSSVAGFSPLPAIRGNGQQHALLMNPVIESREAETAVTVAEGETLVISGMRMVRTTTREDKVPGLGDLPLIGNLFKSHRSQQHMTDLYFFVTPTLASAMD